ncbi:ATP-dependent zinc protease family protein [Shewanella baltica]|uniref:ATP-dependent zinc protease family protein n=1 Tax=Shewanella baltica TaxID=62322 RepID=UPI00217DF675|nr:ATP-dependent zinc protease [Shewanella baltica]MCS6123615.1 ATP-dependent zinc protease [Shewanella baltica]
MLKQLLAIVIATTLGGCAMTEPTTHATVPVDAATFNTRLAQQQDSLIEVINQRCQPQDTAPLVQLHEQVQLLQQQVASLETPKAKTVAVPKQCARTPLGDKFILGEVESVFVDELNTYFATRIDTGAESSSLDARNITLFERDGIQWVRFEVFTQGANTPPQQFEAKVVRFVRIKQDASEKEDRRPVIHAHLKIGQYAAETDLNLTDRSHLDYPLLLGRKFMIDIAVVDVSQRYVHGKVTNQVTSAQ